MEFIVGIQIASKKNDFWVVKNDMEAFWMGEWLSKMCVFSDLHLGKSKWFVNQQMEEYMDLKWMEGMKEEVYIWIWVWKEYQNHKIELWN